MKTCIACHQLRAAFLLILSCGLLLTIPLQVSAQTGQTVTTPGGAVNTVPVFSSSSAIINSDISDSNGVVSVPSLEVGRLNTFRWVDGVQFISVQAAIDDLPAGGGVVIVSPGTYAGPTNIPNGVHIVSANGSLPSAYVAAGSGVTYPPANVVVFQYSSSFTISSVANIALMGIVLDMQNSDGTNFTLTTVSYSTFDIAVINCNSTNPCVTLNTLPQNNANTAENFFHRLITYGGSEGLKLTGTVSGTTDNWFSSVQILYPNSTTAGAAALDFNRNCDSNWFGRVGIWYNTHTFYGVIFNSASNSSDSDADAIVIGWLDFTGIGVDTGWGITFNPSTGNEIHLGIGLTDWRDPNRMVVASPTAKYILFDATNNTGNLLQVGNAQSGCSISNSGNLTCSGSKNAVVGIDGGQRKVALAAIESPKNWFEDFGSGQLSHGSALIKLEPDFAQTVNTKLDYHVFLTANGDCKGLYVNRKTATAFEVHELGGGSSNVRFDYRIVALRKDYESIRLKDDANSLDPLQMLNSPNKLAAKAQATAHSRMK